jgi:hypothetical protein
MFMHSARAFITPVVLIILIALPVHAQVKPTVVSTNPADLASNVSATIPSFTVTFSKPMNTSYGIPGTNGWPGAQVSWSPDKRTFTYTRIPPITPLTSGATITIYLNNPAVPEIYWFRDTEGNYLDPYTYLFSIEGGQTGLSKVTAKPQSGFSWPYYLYIPLNVKSPGVLLVQPNNTGSVSDDPAVHDAAARSLIEGTKYWADELGSPYLIPTFPRPATGDTGYTHALDRGAILTTVPGLERIDLQLMAMIQDARSELGGKGITVGTKVFMVGASASGSFVSRFTMLHPEIVQAASFGCPGFGPIVPVPAWNGQTLPYPEGVADLGDLVDKEFDADSFRAVPLQVWVGDEDDNVDPWWNPSDPEVALVIAAFGGRHLYSRWPRYEAAYYSVTSLGQFVVFPGMGHQFADWAFIREFFERNRASAQPPLPKPQQYTIYFPHVASYLGWETEVALVNTVPGGVAVRGILQAFKGAGGDPLEEKEIEIPAGGRREITIGDFFQNPSEVNYLVFKSDSGFLAGYTRYNQAGNRTSLPAATGVLQGWFPKIENDGYTGFAFINVESTPANVTLRAVGDDGQVIAEKVLEALEPGVQVVGIVYQVFEADVSNARYFYFSSDKKVIAFTASGSDDGQMLDGLPALAEYIR